MSVLRSIRKFRLNSNFISKYKSRVPRFGFNGLGELVYHRTYSRKDPETNHKESWTDTIQRVVEGAFGLKQRHFEQSEILNNINQDTILAENMFDLMWNMKFLPSGRGLWAMGTHLTETKNLNAALNNCAFISTKDLDKEYSKPFKHTMDLLMLGVGVGFDTRGKNKNKIYRPNNKRVSFVIQDTRESWAEATGKLIDSYLKPDQKTLIFDYSKIRKAGEPLKTFGGTSAGFACLKDLHTSLKLRFEEYLKLNKKVDTLLIADIMNLIGKCVVAGNVRRSSQICLGDHNDDVFINLKNYEKYPEREQWGWSSNNSVIADQNMDYNAIAEQIKKNGEPGILWLENARNYGRMIEPPNYKDVKILGVNPCGEQSLESYELCNLVEVFMNRQTTIDDFLNTIKYAFLYGKIVTLGDIHLKESDEVMKRNRRIGTSLSSIFEFYYQHGEADVIRWFNQGYELIQKCDQQYSEWFKVPLSIKTTTVKPSGTISVVSGSSPGIHAHIGKRYHLRRVQIYEKDPILSKIEMAGYRTETAISTPNSKVIEFPIKLDKEIPTQDQISIETQFHLASLAQKYWSDNQVSCTISFKEHESDKISGLLDKYQHSLKSISLLPKFENKTAYKQMPYEDISKREYEERMKKIKPINWDDEKIGMDAASEKFCSNSSCDIASVSTI